MELCINGCVNECYETIAGDECEQGYHWTEQEEAHYRATGLLPAEVIPSDGGETSDSNVI